MAERIALRAGPLSMVFEPATVFLRHVRLGDTEALRGVYVAVRDRFWNTILPHIANLSVQREEASFRIGVDVECREGPIWFTWRGEIAGQADGKILFSMDGTARADFLRSRIGFCVLHPIKECAGKPCTVTHVDGTREKGVFPRLIEPHQPFLDIREIEHEVMPGVAVNVRCEGDTFEMEDQRNWTDCSYKTYCTPLARPTPVEVKAGTTITQSITLTLASPLTPELAEPTRGAAPLVIAPAEGPRQRLPRIGLGYVDLPLAAKAMERLSALHLAHLRVDVPLFTSGYQEPLGRAVAQARALGASLELALYVSKEADRELADLAEWCGNHAAPVASWLVFDATSGLSTPALVEKARGSLAPLGSPVMRIGGGASGAFVNLNRNRPAAGLLDMLCYAAEPQHHAFDDASLMETFEGLDWTVETAKSIAPGIPIGVGPITLHPRRDDSRQKTLFSAAWTLGSLKHLAERGIESASYYRTCGSRGVMDASGDQVYPMYHVLANVGELAGATVVPTRSSDPLRVECLCLENDGRRRMIFANLTDDWQQVKLQCETQRLVLLRLHEWTLREATEAPDRYRATSRELAEPGAPVALSPYETIAADLEDRGQRSCDCRLCP